MAIELTDEMRQAVHEEECANIGHNPDISTMFTFADPHTGRSTEALVAGPDDETFPHVSCKRCGFVWLVIPDPSKNYNEAVQDLNKMIADPATKEIKPVKQPLRSKHTLRNKEK